MFLQHLVDFQLQTFSASASSAMLSKFMSRVEAGQSFTILQCATREIVPGFLQWRILRRSFKKSCRLKSYFVEVEITCWSFTCIKGVVLGSRNFILMKSYGGSRAVRALLISSAHFWIEAKFVRRSIYS